MCGSLDLSGHFIDTEQVRHHLIWETVQGHLPHLGVVDLVADRVRVAGSCNIRWSHGRWDGPGA